MARQSSFPSPTRFGRRKLRLGAVILLLALAAWQAYRSPPGTARRSSRLPPTNGSWPESSDRSRPTIPPATGDGTPASPSTDSAGSMTVRVDRVVDGDTLHLANGERVRLLGVDTPETVKENTPVQPWGPEASAFTKQHVQGQTVRLEFDHEKRDSYGRMLAYVYLGDWFLNEELIRAGLSPAVTKFPYSPEMKQRFRAVEAEARRNRVGIWSGTSGGSASR